MITIHQHLVDKKVCGYVEWKEGLHQEDIQQFGSVTKRPATAYRKLYDIYLEFQLSDDVEKARQYYYGKVARD